MSKPGSAHWRYVWPLAVVFTAAVAWRQLFELPFVGPDAWPYLLQARDALGEPSLLLREAYLADVWEGARFWRPGFVLLGSLQLASFGASPLAFTLVALAGLTALALCAGGLVRACDGPNAEVAASFAALFVLLHPVQLETLPALARNADLWASLLVVGTMLCLARDREQRWPGLVSALLCAFAAPLFKETGLVAPLVGLVVLAPWRRAAARDTRVTLTAAGLVIALAVHVGWRLILLGTLGGYDAVLREVPLGERIYSLLRGLADHQGWGWPALAVGAGLLLAAGLTLTLAERGAASATRRRLAAANLLWMAALFVALVASERCRMRHAVALVAPLGVAAGLWVSSLGSLRRGRTALAAAALAAALLFGLLPGSPLYARAEQWRTSGLVGSAVLGAAEDAGRAAIATREISTAQAGRIVIRAAPTARGLEVTVAPFPYRTRPVARLYGTVARIDSAMVLMPYSVEAALAWSGVPADVEPAGASWAVTPQLLEPAERRGR